MEATKIDHISIAVRNLEEARSLWEPVLGKSGPDDCYIEEQEKIKVYRYQIGEVGLELMESTSDDGEVARCIRNRGEGIMVLSIHVSNTRSALQELEEKGYPLIKGIRSFRNSEYAFIHPRGMNNVLVELIDNADRE